MLFLRKTFSTKTNLYAKHLEKYGDIKDDSIELQKLINNNKKTLE